MLPDPMYQMQFPSILQMKRRSCVHFEQNPYKQTEQRYDSMIDDRIEDVLQGLCVAVSPWIYLIGLQHANRYAKRHSPKLRDSSHAYETLERVLDYYQLPSEKFELVLKDSNEAYENSIQKTIDDKYIIQLDMNNPWTREKSIQHEICHYLNDDFKWDPQKNKGVKKGYAWLRYFALAEPRVILKVIKDDFLDKST